MVFFCRTVLTSRVSVAWLIVELSDGRVGSGGTASRGNTAHVPRDEGGAVHHWRGDNKHGVDAGAATC